MEFKGEFPYNYYNNNHQLLLNPDQNIPNFSSLMSTPFQSFDHNTNPNPNHDHQPSSFLFMNQPTQISTCIDINHHAYEHHHHHHTTYNLSNQIMMGTNYNNYPTSLSNNIIGSTDGNNQMYVPSNYGSSSRANGDEEKSTKVNKKYSNVIIKGQWTPEEDRLLEELVAQHGIKQWSVVANMMKGRLGKQCRERWHNHLKPDIKKDEWSEEEDIILIEAHKKLGNKWTEIAKRLPGRSENTVKNHWNATKRRQTFSRRLANHKSSLLHAYIKSITNSSNNGSTTTSREGSICDNTNTNNVNTNDQYEYPLQMGLSFGNNIHHGDFDLNYNFSRCYDLGSGDGAGSFAESSQFDLEFEKKWM